MAYPQWSKKPRASLTPIVEIATPIASISASRVRASAFRKMPLIFEKASSIGLRFEIRRVGQQVHQLASAPLDKLFNLLALVGREIVHHHDLARLKRGREHPLDIGLKDRAVG